MSLTDWFGGRVAVIATQHEKERVMAPVLTEMLGVSILVPDGLNTDDFGTFTRETPRAGDQHAAARAKAHRALALTGETLAVASEGSFGPHPLLPFGKANLELVMLVDTRHNLAVTAEYLTLETNYNSSVVTSVAAAMAFAEAAGFPAHAMVVTPPDNPPEVGSIIKGITTTSTLASAVTDYLNLFGSVRVETDMRAMMNPTRMRAIERATRQLVEKLQQFCPRCHCPGFGVARQEPGLPCQWCSLPTPLPLAHVSVCGRCPYEEKRLYPLGSETADPGQCSFCNP